jgi:YHS domain-containing protein
MQMKTISHGVDALANRTGSIAAALLASLLLASCAAAPAKVAQVRPVGEIDLQQGFALKGFDPVSYFADGRPAAGNAAISYRWRGAIWLFSTEEHRTAFIADPARYAPQFGGYCAFAVSRGTTADGDPLQWAVVDDKLYVNTNAFAMELWDKDRPGNIRAGNSNWPLIPKQPLPESKQSTGDR